MQQDRQHRPLPVAAERDLAPVGENLERAEDSEFHADTGPIADVTTASRRRLPDCCRRNRVFAAQFKVPGNGSHGAIPTREELT